MVEEELLEGDVVADGGGGELGSPAGAVGFVRVGGGGGGGAIGGAEDVGAEDEETSGVEGVRGAEEWSPPE